MITIYHRPPHTTTPSEHHNLTQLIEQVAHDFTPPLTHRHTPGQPAQPHPDPKNLQSYTTALLTQTNFYAYNPQNQLLGLLSVNYTPNPHETAGCYLTTVAVAPHGRKQGIAKQLYATYLNHPTKPPLPTFLKTWSTNTPHINLLTTLGFFETHRVEHDRAPGIHTIYYQHD